LSFSGTAFSRARRDGKGEAGIRDKGLGVRENANEDGSVSGAVRNGGQQVKALLVAAASLTLIDH
jgi:hypothetical protein